MASTNVGNAFVTVSARFDKSWNGAVATEASAVGNIIASGVTRAFGAITSSLDAAISRVDTMNNFPRIMENMGVGSDAAKRSIDRLSAGIDGLPTALDTAVLGVERFTSKNGDVDKSTGYFLALNDAILAGGASSELQASAVEQLSQSYAKGKMDMMEWRSLQQAMPAQLNQIAKAMGKTTDELGEGLRKGTVSMDEFMDAIVQLDQEGGEGFASFAEQAKTATGGIGTALTNVQNRVNKAMAGIVDAIGAENISGAINAFSSKFKDIAQPVIDFIESFKETFNGAFLSVELGPLETTFSRLGAAIGDMASKAGEFFGNVMTVAAPAIAVLGDTVGQFATMATNVLGRMFDGLNWIFDRFDLMTLGWERQTEAISANSRELDYYTGVIEELSGKEELTALEQVKLTEAVEGYNKITGDSLEIIDAQKGELSKSTEEIKANAEAWKDNAYKQAYYQQVSDIIADTVKKQQELAEATTELAQAEQNLNAFRDDSRSDQAYREELERLETEYDQAKLKVDELSSEIEDNNRKLEEGEERLMAADASLLAYIDSNASLKTMLDRAGVSSTKFSNYLNAIGVSEEDISDMSPKVVSGLLDIVKNSDDMSEEVAQAMRDVINSGDEAADGVESAFEPLGGKIASYFDQAKDGASTALSKITSGSKASSSESQNAFNTLPSYLGSKFADAKSRAAAQLGAVSSKALSTSSSTSSAFNSVPGTIRSWMAEAKSGATRQLDGISSGAVSVASNVVSKFSGLGGRVSRAIGGISFPQPHISWSTISVLGRSVSFPRVQWYATGGFVDGAQLIGVGEAGPEMILPQSGGLMDSFASAVTEEVDMSEVVSEIREFRREIGPIISQYTPGMTVGELADRLTPGVMRKMAGGLA